MRASEPRAAESALIEDADEIDHDIFAAEALAQLRGRVHLAVLQGQAGQHQEMLVLFPVAR